MAPAILPLGFQLPAGGKRCGLPEKNRANVERARPRSARVRLEREDRCRRVGCARNRELNAQTPDRSAVRFSLVSVGADDGFGLLRLRKEVTFSRSNQEFRHAQIAAHGFQLEAASELEWDLEAQRHPFRVSPARARRRCRLNSDPVHCVPWRPVPVLAPKITVPHAAKKRATRGPRRPPQEQ
jgi:hypothetical protein